MLLSGLSQAVYLASESSVEQWVEQTKFLRDFSPVFKV